MKTCTFDCTPQNKGARWVLKQIAKAINSAPLTAHLKTSVPAYRIDTDLAGAHFTLITNNDMVHQSLMRNIQKITEAVQAIYRDDIAIETVKVEKA